MMKVHLLHPEDDAPMDPVEGESDLVRDLGLDDVVARMADGDQFVRTAATATLLRPLTRTEDIAWRQGVLADARAHPSAVRELQRIALDGVNTEVRVRGWWISAEPSSVLGRSVALMRALLEPLRALRRWAATHEGVLRSEGMRALLATIDQNLSEDWFTTVERHLRQLQYSDVVMTAHLGRAGKGTGYVLHAMEQGKRPWRAVLGSQRADDLTLVIAEMDTVGGQAVSDLRDRAISGVAETLAQSTEQVLSFFAHLRWEVAFVVGTVTLHERLTALGMPLAVPVARPAGRELTARGLYDVGLALRSGRAVVPSDLAADGAGVVVITGANQGGKSTLLRAVGLAQLMMQAGMPVGAEEYRASVAGRVHTHFRREEDETLRSGKLHEELVRMSRIVDRANPGDLLLSNESFASTNEREGSRIATQIVEGLADADVRVIMVTHLYEFSRSLAGTRSDALFLRAERAPDGERTFRIVPGEALPTSHGADLWRRVFGTEPDITP